ncbi:MAG: cupredoxin domain-containing protein [Patescibacteria group bacterium]
MEPQAVVSPETPNPKSKKLLLIIIGLVIFTATIGLLLANNSRSNPPNSNTAITLSKEEAKVDIKADQFIPGTIKVKPGTTVTWANTDTKPHRIAADPHPMHSSLPGLLSDDLNQGDSYSYVFEKPGTYTYHDEQQPLSARGTVIVSE